MSEQTAFEVGRLYELIKRIADTLTASQKDVFVRLPGLLAYYTGGTRGINAALSDHSGSALPVFQTGVCPTGYDGNSFAHLGNGINYFWSNQAAFGITGLETHIDSSMRGLTIGGWFEIDSSPSAASGLMSKFGAVTQYGYSLVWTSADLPLFQVSGTGSALISATAPAATINAWHFIVGRFIPSAEIAVFVDGDKAVNTAAVPASINVSTQNFEVGRYLNDNNRVIHGKARDVFICAAALSDALIEEIRATSVP